MGPDELIEEIAAAHARIRDVVRHTPLERSAGLSADLGIELYLKGEHLQHTGSFKFRGASNKIMKLSAADRKKGVLTASSGNHGLALATAAATLDVPVAIYMSKAVSPAKLDAIRAFGAETVLVDGDALAAELEARATAEKTGRAYVSPYNDYDIVAGQGTIGVELAESGVRLDAVFVSVGGGGLISGIGSWLKSASPETLIIGCWPENAPAMLRALEKGEIFEVPESPTLSDGTAGGVEADALTFPICRRVIDETLTVSEDEIARAMRDVAECDHWITEGSAGVAVAAARKWAAEHAGATAAAILCGRNIALETFIEAVTRRG